MFFQSEVEKSFAEGRWIHPLCYPLPVSTNGPFINLNDGSLMTIDQKGMRISKDDGRTWLDAQAIPICKEINPKEPASFYLLQTKDKAIVIVYLNYSTRKWCWDEKKGEPGDSQCELWSIRSLDGGKTWIDKQRLLGGYNANFFGFIQTSTGRLVATVEHCVSNPGRWVACSLISDDDGESWKRSNFIDLGGHGDHDGATEPTVVELSDGRILMLIRTPLGCFWQALSEDMGSYWRTIQPSRIDASHSPGYLLRLQSGRLVLVWNRQNPQGGIWPKRGPDRATEVSTSWHREELSIAFSEDDTRTWTEPIVIGRQKGGQISYPFIFEHRPGELWITAGFTWIKEWGGAFLPFRVRIDEEEFFARMVEEK